MTVWKANAVWLAGLALSVGLLIGCGKKEKASSGEDRTEQLEAPQYEMPLGSPIPLVDMKMKNVDGTLVAIEDVIGDNGVVVLFLSNSCPDVRTLWAPMREAVKLCRRNGIGVIAVNSNDPKHNDRDGFQGNRELAEELSFPFPYVVDATNGLALQFGASRTPEAFLFNGDRRLIYHGAVAAHGGKAPLKIAVEQHIGGQGIGEPRTQSGGCPILWPKKW